MLFTSRPSLLQVIRISGFIALGLACFLSYGLYTATVREPAGAGVILLFLLFPPWPTVFAIYGFRYAWLTCGRIRPLSVQHFVGGIAGVIPIGWWLLFHFQELHTFHDSLEYVYPATVILCWIAYRIVYPRVTRYLFPEPNSQAVLSDFACGPPEGPPRPE